MGFNNLSDALTSIKMDLGIYGLALPVDVEKGMMDVIDLKTLVTFSVFVPYRFEFSCNPAKLEQLRDNNNYQYSGVRLPVQSMFPQQRLIHILDVKPLTNSAINGYVSPMYNGDLNLYNSMMMAQANVDLLSAASPKFTWKFVDPDQLYLFNYSTVLGGEVIITLGLSHTKNLATVKPTTHQTFMELATLDIKAFLFNTVKHHDELASAFATINLKIDDWREAAQKREDLIENWKNVYHLDFPSFIII